MSDRSYLDFEQPLAELEKKIAALRARAKAENLDMSDAIRALEKRSAKLERDIFHNLTRWQKYQLSRHPQRPYSLDYIDLMMSDFIELHGDRCSGNDRAIVGGLAYFEGRPIVVIGQQKGRNTQENLERNFGLPHPEGYRKALRLMQLAAKFDRPVLCLIDTPGAFPGLASEQRGISEAIARNLFEMARLPIPIVVAIIGEGASGGRARHWGGRPHPHARKRMVFRNQSRILLAHLVAQPRQTHRSRRGHENLRQRSHGLGHHRSHRARAIRGGASQL